MNLYPDLDNFFFLSLIWIIDQHTQLVYQGVYYYKDYMKSTWLINFAIFSKIPNFPNLQILLLTLLPNTTHVIAKFGILIRAKIYTKC